MNQMAVEIAKFVIDPANEPKMRKARVVAMAAIRTNTSGMLDTRLCSGKESGEWFDLIFWESMELAEAAAERAMAIPEAAEYFSYITEPPTMIHGTVVLEDLVG